MYIIGKNNKLGRKTFWYFFITKNIFGIFLVVLTFFLAYASNFGLLKEPLSVFLLKNISYVSTSMVSSWFLMLAVSILIILFARTSVLYKQYSFVLHQHALHIIQGIFFIKEQIIPYPQITNVEIVRPYVYSLFGMAKVNIETSRSDNTSSNKHSKTKELPPMDKNKATKLAHELMRRAALQNGYEFDKVGMNGSQTTKRRKRR